MTPAVLAIVVSVALFIFTAISGLIGIIYNSLARRITRLEDGSITKDNCIQCAKNKEDKIDTLKQMFDTRSKDVVSIVGRSNELMEKIIKRRK